MLKDNQVHRRLEGWRKDFIFEVRRVPAVPMYRSLLLLLKGADIAGQLTLLAMVLWDLPGWNNLAWLLDFLPLLYWQCASYFLHLFLRGDWKKRTLRIVWGIYGLLIFVGAGLFIITIILSFIGLLLVLLFGPVLLLAYFGITIAELLAAWRLRSD